MSTIESIKLDLPDGAVLDPPIVGFMPSLLRVNGRGFIAVSSLLGDWSITAGTDGAIDTIWLPAEKAAPFVSALAHTFAVMAR